jgi:hypothetical protein
MTSWALNSNHIAKLDKRLCLSEAMEVQERIHADDKKETGLWLLFLQLAYCVDGIRDARTLKLKIAELKPFIPDNTPAYHFKAMLGS